MTKSNYYKISNCDLTYLASYNMGISFLELTNGHLNHQPRKDY
jgi:hypothetical protein